MSAEVETVVVAEGLNTVEMMEVVIQVEEITNTYEEIQQVGEPDEALVQGNALLALGEREGEQNEGGGEVEEEEEGQGRGREGEGQGEGEEGAHGSQTVIIRSILFYLFINVGVVII